MCSFPQIALATGDVQEIRGAADLRRIKLKVCAMSVSGAWCRQAFEPAYGIGRGGSVCVLIQSFPCYFQIGQACSYAHICRWALPIYEGYSLLVSHYRTSFICERLRIASFVQCAIIAFTKCITSIHAHVQTLREPNNYRRTVHKNAGTQLFCCAIKTSSTVILYAIWRKTTVCL